MYLQGKARGGCMFNFSWGVLFVLVTLSCFVLCYRLFGRVGLYAWIGFATVLANIQVTKTIDMFGVVMTLGNTMYVTLYLGSDLLNEKYGRPEARKAVWFGFFTLMMTTIIMQMVLVFTPREGDVVHPSMEIIFGFMPRLAIGSLAAYLVSQFLDVRLYAWIRKFYPKPGQLWIRTNGSAIISSFVDTLIFCTIAFAGHFSLQEWIEILLTTYIIKFLLTAVGTPFLYLARRFHRDEQL